MVFGVQIKCDLSCDFYMWTSVCMSKSCLIPCLNMMTLCLHERCHDVKKSIISNDDNDERNVNLLTGLVIFLK